MTLVQKLEAQAVYADADLLRRVIENLIDNALRHSPPDSTLRLTALSREGAVEIQVADGGRGVAPEQREQIFERFAQGSAEELLTRSGRSLGLTFCRLMIEAHGGKIWVEDNHPGAVFCVRLPEGTVQRPGA